MSEGAEENPQQTVLFSETDEDKLKRIAELARELSVPPPDELPTKPPPKVELTKEDDTPEEPKKRIAFYVPVSMADEIQSTVVHLAGYPHMLTMGKLAELAFPMVLEDLRQKHNDGKPFPPLPEKVKAKIKGGRPVGS